VSSIDTDVVLQPADLLTERGLGGVQQISGFTEAELFGDRDEVPDVP
jgi:hypothetical protein